MMLCLIALLCLADARADEPPPAGVQPEIFDLTSHRRGPSWVLLQWDSTVLRHDVQFGEVRPGWRRPLRWETVEGVYALSYSIANLAPDTEYQFRVRAHPLREGQGEVAESEAITVHTRPAKEREWAGLLLWPQRQLQTSPDAVTQPSIEAYRGKLYVLEAESGSLKLSRIDPGTSDVDWTRAIGAQVNEPPLAAEAPDLCVFDDKLWMTWHVRRGGPEGSDESTCRQRLMFCDLYGEEREDPGEDLQALLSAPLEIHPTVAGRETCYGSLCPYLGSVWVSWVEVWTQDDGGSRAQIMLASYDPTEGGLRAPVVWSQCPSACPGSVSISPFEGELVVLFSDRSGQEEGGDSEGLLSARFDGKRFHDIQRLRGLGRNLRARGAQLQDRFYFVYQSDAYYPAGGGMYFDIALGCLPPGHAGSAAYERAFATGAPYIADMKHNADADICALGDSLFVVSGKRDEPPGEAAWRLMMGAGAVAPTARGFGTYLGRITRSVGE